MSKLVFNSWRVSRRLAIILLSMTLFMSGAQFAFGSSYDYTTDSYDVNVNVAVDNSYTIVEKIQVNFNTDKHGIFRYIPLSSMAGQRDPIISDEWVEDYMYDVYEEDGCDVIRIGDPDETVTGKQTYNLGYKMTIVDDKDTTGDMMYLDVLPTGWETPIKRANVTVTFPKPVNPTHIKAYTGKYGSREEMDFSYDESSKTLSIKGYNFEKGQGITLLCRMQEGYWENQKNYDADRPAAMVMLVIMALAIVVLWFFFGKDKKPVVTVEFYPPKGLNPADVGYIIDGKVDKKDLVCLLMYFADRGYLSIEQYKKKKFAVKKLKNIDSDEEAKFARVFFDGLFKKGDYVMLDDLDEDFGESYMAAHDLLNSKYSKTKNLQVTKTSQLLRFVSFGVIIVMMVIVGFLSYEYGGDPTGFGAGGIFCAALSVIIMLLLLRRERKILAKKKAGKFTGFVILWAIDLVILAVAALSIGYSFGEYKPVAIIYIAAMAVSKFFMVKMEKRTEKGTQLLGKILGLKNFIETAELEKLNLLVEENPDYYYNILPYAYVLGLTDKWAKNFENIKIVQPGWYSSYDGGYMDRPIFNAWMVSNMMGSCNHALTKNIHIPTPEGSDIGGGGFSSGGGGFSGGGFGGGGGGSW